MIKYLIGKEFKPIEAEITKLIPKNYVLNFYTLCLLKEKPNTFFYENFMNFIDVELEDRKGGEKQQEYVSVDGLILNMAKNITEYKLSFFWERIDNVLFERGIRTKDIAVFFPKGNVRFSNASFFKYALFTLYRYFFELSR